MALSPLADAASRTRQRTVRRLVVVLILIAVAIVALALLDRASKRVIVPPEPAGKLAPSMGATPVPAPSPIVAAPPQDELTAPAVESVPQQPPPPPAVLNNETLPPPKQSEPRRKTEAAMAEDTHPVTSTEPEVVVTEKPGSATASVPKMEGKSTAPIAPKIYVLQLGVFSSTENAHALQERLAKAGIQSYAETRVQVGPFKDKADAEKARMTLKQLGVNAVIVPQR